MRIVSAPQRKPSQEAIDLFVKIRAKSTGKTEKQVRKEMEDEDRKHEVAYKIIRKNLGKAKKK